MGFMSGLGKALMAPIKATNKVANKIPGVKQTVGVMNKIPGMQTANKFNPMMSGLGNQNKPPIAGGGIGPSPQMTPTNMPVNAPAQRMPELPQGQGGDTMGGYSGPPPQIQTLGSMGGGGMPGGIGPQQNMLQQLMQKRQMGQLGGPRGMPQ